MKFKRNITASAWVSTHAASVLVLGSCSLLTLQTIADNRVDNTNHLDGIVVTATRSQESIGSIAGKVQVIESEELQRQLQAGDNLSIALGRLIPNLGVGTETTTGATQTIRGRKPLYLIDGVPQSDNRNVSRFLNSISPLFVERIEVVTGASSIYGVGGIGGVINIITRSGAKQDDGATFTTQIGANVSTEEFDSDSLQINIGQTMAYKQGAFDSFVGLEYTETRGSYDSDGERIPAEPAQTSTNDSEVKAGLLKLGWQFDENKRVQLAYDSFDSEQDSDYGPNYGGPGVPVLLLGQSATAEPIKGLKLDEQPKTERESISLQYSNKDFFGSQLTALVYQREREYRFFPFAFNLGSNSFVNQSTSEVDVFGTKLVLDTEINPGVSIVYGIDYQRDKGRQTAVGYDLNTFATSGGLNYQKSDSYGYGPDVETETLGGFAELAVDVNDYLLLRGGLRYEKVEQTVDDYLPTFEYLLVGDY